jgi:hypothetical protein
MSARSICRTVLLAALAAAGCWPMTVQENHGIPPGGPTTLMPLRPAPLVTPDEVTDANYAEKMRALQEEIEHARRDPPPGVINEATTPARPGR